MVWCVCVSRFDEIHMITSYFLKVFNYEAQSKFSEEKPTCVSAAGTNIVGSLSEEYPHFAI